MKDDKRDAGHASALANAAAAPGRILGSLREALNAASRDDRSGAYRIGSGSDRPETPKEPAKAEAPRAAEPAAQVPPPAPLSAAEAVREAKARTRDHFEADPTTIAVRAAGPKTPPKASVPVASNDDEAPKTQALRGKPRISRTNFAQDPVVGWLVVVGGAGLGAFRPIYEGNNAIGRGKNQRIPLDFGDETISSEEQAYIRYDSVDRSFLFVPNLAKTNIVAVNDKKPTGAVKLEMMDVIRMGQTQLAFVPFCGEAFDWAELSELKE